MKHHDFLEPVGQFLIQILLVSHLRAKAAPMENRDRSPTTYSALRGTSGGTFIRVAEDGFQMFEDLFKHLGLLLVCGSQECSWFSRPCVDAVIMQQGLLQPAYARGRFWDGRDLPIWKGSRVKYHRKNQ